jgi:hypothetical protein
VCGPDRGQPTVQREREPPGKSKISSTGGSGIARVYRIVAGPCVHAAAAIAGESCDRLAEDEGAVLADIIGVTGRP